MNCNQNPNPWDSHSQGWLISKMSIKQSLLLNNKEKEKQMRNKETDWEQVAHELAYAIMCLEDDSDTPKVWRKAWKALQRYEEACLGE